MWKPGFEPVPQAFTVVENRAKRGTGLLFAARDHDLKWSLKENNARFRALKQSIADGFCFDCASAHGKNQVVLANQFLDNFRFKRAECSLSLLREDIGNGSTGAIFDYPICVEETPLQALREK